MERFALLNGHTGYVWWVGNAENAAAACMAADAEIGGRPYESRYEYEPASRAEAEMQNGYLVYSAPSDFDVEDGMSSAEIERVIALDYAGGYVPVRAD